jgi:nitrate/TMAO reductase-like tetraheme cytochrome c subunit
MISLPARTPSGHRYSARAHCVDCHGETNMHGSYPFFLSPDRCKSCHDYDNQLEGRTSVRALDLIAGL